MYVENISQDVLEDICHQVLDLYSMPVPDRPQDSPPPTPTVAPPTPVPTGAPIPTIGQAVPAAVRRPPTTPSSASFQGTNFPGARMPTINIVNSAMRPQAGVFQGSVNSFQPGQSSVPPQLPLLPSPGLRLSGHPLRPVAPPLLPMPPSHLPPPPPPPPPPPGLAAAPGPAGPNSMNWDYYNYNVHN